MCRLCAGCICVFEGSITNGDDKNSNVKGFDGEIGRATFNHYKISIYEEEAPNRPKARKASRKGGKKMRFSTTPAGKK